MKDAGCGVRVVRTRTPTFSLQGADSRLLGALDGLWTQALNAIR